MDSEHAAQLPRSGRGSAYGMSEAGAAEDPSGNFFHPWQDRADAHATTLQQNHLQPHNAHFARGSTLSRSSAFGNASRRDSAASYFHTGMTPLAGGDTDMIRDSFSHPNHAAQQIDLGGSLLHDVASMQVHQTHTSVLADFPADRRASVTSAFSAAAARVATTAASATSTSSSAAPRQEAASAFPLIPEPVPHNSFAYYYHGATPAPEAVPTPESYADETADAFFVPPLPPPIPAHAARCFPAGLLQPIELGFPSTPAVKHEPPVLEQQSNACFAPFEQYEPQHYHFQHPDEHHQQQQHEPPPHQKPRSRKPASGPRKPAGQTASSSSAAAAAAAANAAALAEPVKLGRPRDRKLAPEERAARRAQRLLLRKQRKSLREKSRREHENAYFAELAELCGLPADQRDKATILEAVLAQVEADAAQPQQDMLQQMQQQMPQQMQLLPHPITPY